MYMPWIYLTLTLMFLSGDIFFSKIKRRFITVLQLFALCYKTINLYSSVTGNESERTSLIGKEGFMKMKPKSHLLSPYLNIILILGSSIYWLFLQKKTHALSLAHWPTQLIEQGGSRASVRDMMPSLCFRNHSTDVFWGHNSEKCIYLHTNEGLSVKINAS